MLQQSGSIAFPDATSPGSSRWVFALEGSPTVQHSYQVRPRQIRGTSGWLQGGGIVDIMIDDVPTGQLIVIANKTTAREDIVQGAQYRLEMAVTSNGLAPAKIDALVSVNGIPLTAS